MGDSDDEYDRKRRDKFRGERTEYRDGRRDDRRREEWIDRESWGRSRARTDYRDYRGRERYSPVRSHDISPPIKRVRTDWEDRRFSHDSGYNSYNTWSHDGYGTHSNYAGHGNNQRDADVGQTQPPMMSFKAFLQTQDDNITDEDAIKKYNEYKLEFKRQQLNEFFVSHKEEEWFKIKYHPEDSVKRKDEQMTALKNRVSVFMEFLDQNRYDIVSVDADQSEKLVKLLDALVIRLEGGTDFDLQILNQPTPPEKEEDPPPKPFIPGEEKEEKKERDKAPEPPEPKKDPSQPLKLTITSEQVELAKKAKEFLKQKGSDDGEVEETGKKRKREYDFESGSDSGDELDDPPHIEAVEEQPPPPGLDGKDESMEEDKPVENGESKDDDEKEEGEEDDDLKKDEKTDEEELPEEESKKEDNKEKEKDEKEEEEEEEGAESEVEKVKKDSKPKPRPLHMTASVFLRNLAPTITKAEVEAMCKRYPGFLRVAIADPQPERRWFRRGWVTFERHVNIKEICWNLNNIRLRDCELGAIVNRDLSRRIRTVNGITSHKEVVRHDIKLAARIVQNLDARWGLWADAEGEHREVSDAPIPSFGLVSKNPVLKNITDYLIEEAPAEEEELLGHSADQEEGQLGEECATVERDEELIKVLDKLLLYLRAVHSVDYYNHSEYPNEDEMPNRCGIMHARGIPPSSKVTQQEISDYCRQFEQKIASFLQAVIKVTEDELGKLGAKDSDTEIEKFIQANTQELAKDKWLCPLSGKKFKGPEFVRKHIFNKHAEKVDEVKQEVEYFNNYLRDPKRPQLAEHPGNRTQRKESTGERETYTPQAYMPHYNYNYGGGGRHGGGYNNYNYGGYNRDGYNRDNYSRPPRGNYNRGRGDYRPVINYRDLDAPREPEEF